MAVLCFLLTSLISFALGVVASDINHIGISRYRVRDGRIKKEFRIVALSDLHGRCFGRGNKRLVRKIAAQKPDMVLMAGDIMTAKDFLHSIEGSVDVACALIKDISKICPVYFAPGNHESRIEWMPWKYSFSYGDMLRRFTEAGAHILDNDSVALDAYGLRIYGLSLGKGHYLARRFDHVSKQQMRRMLGAADKERYAILLAHDPEFLTDYAKWGADMSISGHYHGGIVRLPGIGGLISPKRYILPDFTAGVFSLGGHKQLVSRGLGTHTLPLRFFNPAELIVIDMKRGE